MHHHIGDTFDVPLAALGLNPARNYRRATAEDPTLAELEQSMRELGQLQPILVAYDDGGALGLVAGFRRATAAQAIGWTTVRATLIDGANADLARLARTSTAPTHHLRDQPLPLRAGHRSPRAAADLWGAGPGARAVGLARPEPGAGLPRRASGGAGGVGGGPGPAVHVRAAE
ncbi:MAG: ParB N-terminal domain-containing protein [Deltaproteobacteria bacterium]|nr:ParB N-terminal domain-containing protein [Deltaproteobacteria bacterium]